MIGTIDGPTASGKSTVAKLLARDLGWYYLNTGLLYRAVAYLLTHRHGYTDEQLSFPLESDIEKCLRTISYTYDNNQGASIVVDHGHTITGFLKTQTIDTQASIVSANYDVRRLLLSFQRELAKHHAIIVDGRDTGSIVFPQAEYKFFLTASFLVRAQRWQKDQALQGKIFSLQESEETISERDRRDSTRAYAPLIIPKGGYVIDNSDITIEQTVAAILRYIRNF